MQRNDHLVSCVKQFDCKEHMMCMHGFLTTKTHHRSSPSTHCKMNGGGVEDGRRDDSKLKQLPLANASHPGATIVGGGDTKLKRLHTKYHPSLAFHATKLFHFRNREEYTLGDLAAIYTRSRSSSPRQKRCNATACKSS
jgi:hypothetical protein